MTKAIAAAGLLVLVTVLSCRRGEPDGEPRTPPNSPIPAIDRKEPDPKPGPPALTLDAG